MSAINNNSLSVAILHAKCPQCRKGDMFKYKWWKVSKFVKFYQICKVCQLRFDREPGFFYGAMYISYAMIVAMVTTTWFILYFVFRDPVFEVYVISIIVLNIVLLPMFFRYSRVLYLYAFGGVNYNHQLNQE
jgi:uncharacterized protein (DUF983 family)